MTDYDAVLVLSFGGPEGPDDVLPFLENVTRGRRITRERLEQVGAHYHVFGGRSPINDQNRSLIASLELALAAANIDLPVYWGNRNWHPMLEDTVGRMADDGVQHALAFVTSATSSYSACRQYLDDIERARLAVGDPAPKIDKIRQYYDHPGFIEPMIENVRAAQAEAGIDARLVFTAHSIPLSMANTSDYETQLHEASRLIARGVEHERWDLVWQSRSGPPSVPWLEPDVNDHLESLSTRGIDSVVIVPAGFVSDHMEVLYDLDTEVAATASRLGIGLVRADTVGTDERFVTMIVELIEERRSNGPVRALGDLAVRPNVCEIDCCLKPVAPSRRS